MLTLDGFQLKPFICIHDALHLYRGVRLVDEAPVLVQIAVRSTPPIMARLQHEFDLRDQLDPVWAAQSLELQKGGSYPALIQHDPGGELLENLLGTAMPVALFLRLAMGITRAVAALHQREIIHKDLQPAHLLVDTSTGNTHLFGLGNASRVLREHQTPIPLEVISGNLAYMAPELTGRVNRSIDCRSDLYTLGVCFYQMITGVLPFIGEDAIGWVHHHIARQALPPVERNPVLPPMLSALIMKLLEKNAEERYQTANGLLSDLQHCKKEWDSLGCIHEFGLAGEDEGGRLLVPEKLYGREQPRQVLLDAVEQVLSTGVSELVLVSGYSGIGKSSLVHGLQKVLVQHRAWFVTGKFDQQKSNIPYATVAQTFQSLVRQMLGQSQEELDEWRDAILQAVGSNGQLLLDLIPELKYVIGPQPACVELAPTETQNRFQTVFGQFLSVCASDAHPLIVFLDDWQWMDVASQRLISDLLVDSGVHYFLLIGAYRDTDLVATDPLAVMLDALHQQAAIIRQIVLEPLSLEHVQQLLADTLHASPEYVAPLASMVYEKTAGNPLFTIQSINLLAEERWLFFDIGTRQWQWDLAGIEAQGFSDNVIDLMISKLQRLPQVCIDVVKMLACLGNRAEVVTLAKVCDHSEAATEAALWPVLKLGLLSYHETYYSFAHDRVQEAAYLLTDVALRPQVHLNIGRLLVAPLSPEAIEEDIFTIVSQFNYGVQLIDDPQERAQLSHFNYLAGKKAKDLVAYAAARGYFMAASKLQANNAWDTHYTESFALYLALSECEYLTGHFDDANDLFQLLSQRARCKLDQARVTTLRSDLYQLSGHIDGAVDVGLDLLRLFGVTFPEDTDGINAALAQEFSDIETAMRGCDPAELLHLPNVTDPSIRVVIACFADIASALHQIRPELFVLLTAKTINFLLRHGNAVGASMAYACYAIILMSQAQTERAFAFSEMSVEINRRFHDPRRSGIITYLHGVFFHSWRKSIVSSLPILEEAFIACVEAGNFVWAGYCAFVIPWASFDSGMKLDEVRRVIKKNQEFAQHSHNQVAENMNVLLSQMVSCLQGNTQDECSFDDAQYQEAEILEAFGKACYVSGTCTHSIFKQIVAVVYGQSALGLQEAAKAGELSHVFGSTMLECSHVFYYGLSASAAYFQVPEDQKEALRQIVVNCLQKIQAWAGYSPENFSNRHHLLSAELARMDGRMLEAMDHYDSAIQSAHEHGFIQNEALANERAAQFFFARGSEKIARTYLRDARFCYFCWGAQGKVMQMDRHFPGLHSRSGDGVQQTSVKEGARVEHLDLMSVIKASQAVSADIVLDHLIEALLRIVIEHAGADRALLLMPQAGQLQVAAQAEALNEQILVLVDPVSDAVNWPVMMVNYVARAQDKVLLDDVASPHSYSNDPYWQKSAAQSALCLPLVKQATLVGVLYLENTLVQGAFTHGRIAVIELLASQAAIALENAILFANLAREQSTIRELNASLEQRVIERTAELQRTLMEQQAILDNAYTGISIVRENRIFRCNLGQEQLLGYEPGELIGHDIDLLFSNDAEIAIFREQAAPKIAAGKTYVIDIELVRKNGSLVWCSLYGKAIDANQLSLGLVWVMQDISSRKRNEQALLEHSVALQTSLDKLHETQMQLVQQEKMASIGTLTAGIAHEINNPAHFAHLGAYNLRNKLDQFHQFLLSLAGPDAPPVLLELMKQHMEGLNGDLNVISEGTLRIRDLVRDLRTFSRLDEADWKAVLIADSLLSTVNLVRTQYLETAKISLSLEANPILECYPAQLNQVFMNLIVNACQAIQAKRDAIGSTAGPGELWIRTRMDGDGVIFEFEDNGCGMSEETLDKIFDPFFTTKTVGMGMGMGLSISFGIIKKHHGTIQVQSVPGRGSCFILHLPLLPSKMQ